MINGKEGKKEVGKFLLIYFSFIFYRLMYDCRRHCAPMGLYNFTSRCPQCPTPVVPVDLVAELRAFEEGRGEDGPALILEPPEAFQ